MNPSKADNPNTTTTKTMKVCVVGAGFAGLSVAYHLTKYNNNNQNNDPKNPNKPKFDIHILEARDRIGGRVYPFDLNNVKNNGDGNDDESVIVDMGGQWIHEASKKNPLVDLLKELDIPLLYAKNDRLKKKQQQQKQQQQVQSSKSRKKKKEKNQDTPKKQIESGTYMSDGTRIPDPTFKKASRFYYKALGEYNKRHITSQTSFQDLLDDAIKDLEKSTTQQKTQQKIIRGGGSNNKDASTKSDDESTTSEQQQQHQLLFKQILDLLGHRTECYEGGRLFELSVELDDLYKNLGGPDEIADGGYNTVLNKVSDFIQTSTTTTTTKIHFNSEVKSIQYNCDGDGDGGSGSSGSDYHGNDSSCVRIRYCTSTTSTADDDDDDDDQQRQKKKKKGDDDDVENLLLLEADCCVCTVPLGVLKRNVIKFDPPLSDEHQRSIDAIGMGVLDKVMMLFDSKFWPDDGDDFYVGIINDDPTKIQTFIDCSGDYGGKPVLAMLLGGNVARRFDNENDDDDDIGLLSDEQIIDEAMTTLRTLFRKNNGGDITTIPEKPISFKVSRWLQDPYAYGSYSFAKVGSCEKDYEIVGQPAAVGSNMFFAGEHTSKNHHSTVHGAWMTGQREADRIIQIFTTSKSATTTTTTGVK